MNSRHYKTLTCGLAMILLASCSVQANADDDFSQALRAVRAVQLNGKGNSSAVQAMAVLNQAKPEQIPQMLEAMDGVNAIALNWLRSAINQAVNRNPDGIPKDAILKYFEEHSHHPMGRLMAFELLTDGDDSLTESMTRGLIDDPSLPLRFKAIEQLVGEAESAMESDKVTATGKLGYALSKARDVSQIQSIATKLESLGVQVDLQDQLGMLNTWHLVGSFDNKDQKGFDVVYGPESNVAEVDLTATYDGIDESPSAWKKVTTGDPVGNVDLNSLVGKIKGATVYAYTTFKYQEDQDAQFRIGSANATKIWLNGELVMSNEIYHNSNSIDKFIGDVKLKKGDNQILIKVCQNEQTEPWAQDWQFQFRICDQSGKAIPEFVPPAQQY
ncbi:MAG: hypothetical protein AAFN77_05115 [Planctomycetota bacterium]